MKVGDIQEGGKSFRFRSEATKSNRDDIIPVDSNLRRVMKEMNLFKANPRHYIFSVKKIPSDKPVGESFFSKRFAVIRKMAGLSNEFSIYGFRHTRATHLIKDGVKLADISRMFRHADIAVTAKYIRDLGQDFDSTDLTKRSRKI